MEVFKIPQLCLYSVHVSLAYKRDVKTCFLDHDLYFEFDAILGPNTFFKTPKKDSWAFLVREGISLSKLHPSASVLPRYTKECTTFSFFPSTYIAGSMKGNPATGLCITTAFFRLISKPKALHTYAEQFIKRCIFFFRMCNNDTVIYIKQPLQQREGRLWVSQQPTDIVYFTWRSISDVDTIWIFIESHKKNYLEVDGKERGCRNDT